MASVLLPLAALAVIAYALHGYGTAVLRLLLPGQAKDPGLALAAGIAAFNVGAGVLELGCNTSAGAILVLVAVGTGLSTYQSRHRWPRLAYIRTVPMLQAAAVSALLLVFLVNATQWDFGSIDDRMGYLVFPERILQEGCIGRDPFQFRRIEAGLGAGGAYDYALFRAFLDASQTRIADLGLGSVCLLLLVMGQLRSLGCRPWQRAPVLLAGLLVVAFSPIVNNTPETLGKAMLFALLRVVVEAGPDKPSARRGVLLALLFCCIALLKTSYLPPAVAVVATFYGVSALAGLSRALLAEGMASGAAVVAALLPWMLVSHAIAGTAWYPLLGTGTLGDAEVAGFTRLQQFVRDGGRVALILAPACLTAAGIALYCPSARSRLLVALPFAILVLGLAAQAKYTLFGYRYGHMAAATVFLFYLPYALATAEGHLRVVQGAAYATALVVLLSSNTLGYRWFDDGLLGQVALGRPLTRNRLVAWSGKAQPFQLAVPAGQPLLVLVSWPSLLDFSRNRISVMDWPGMMGPPGMPALTDYAGWRLYLMRAGIDYVAYSYGDEAGFTERQVAKDLATYSSAGRFSQFQLHLATNFQAVKRMFTAMRGCSDPVFDDGTVAVFSLPSIAPACLQHPVPPA